VIGLSLAGMRWFGWGIRLDVPLAGGFWVGGVNDRKAGGRAWNAWSVRVGKGEKWP